MSLPADPLFYLLAAIAVILVGLGKGGFSGLGSASMPVMTLAIDPISGAAILLPLFLSFRTRSASGRSATASIGGCWHGQCQGQ